MAIKKEIKDGNGLRFVLTTLAMAVICFGIAISPLHAEEATAEPEPTVDGSGSNPDELPNYTNTVEGKDGIALVLEPLDANYFDQNRIAVHFKYRVRGRNLPAGSAEVRLRDRYTGATFKKKFPVEYTMGEHFHWAAWGGEGKGTSSKASDLDAMLLGELLEDDEIPDGSYIPGLTLFASDGSVIANLDYTEDQVRHMNNTGTLVGKYVRKLGKKTINERVAEIRDMYDKLLAAEEEAKATGADVTAPHFMTLALKETLRQSANRVASKNYDVVQDNYEYCTNEVPRVLAQLKQYRDNPASAITAPPLPRPKNERMTIKDGYFWVGDEPVFMSGMCMFAHWMDLDIMRELGYNLIHVGMDPGGMFSTSEEPSDVPRIGDKIPGLKNSLQEILDECERLGIKVDLGITSQGIPEWFYQKHPDARLKGHSVAGFIPYDIESPDVHELLSKYYAEVMKVAAGHPAINTIWLANEPTYLNYGDRTMSLYQAEMLAKYGDLAGINKAWGTSLTNIAEVTAHVRNSPQAHADFWWFNLDRLTKHFQWMSDEIHKYDPDVPTNFKLNNLILGWYCPSPNVDQEAVSDIGSVIGCDSGAFPFAIPYYDWLKSLDPDRPLINLEFKSGGIRSGLDMWKAALHGHAAIDYWCWHPKSSFATAMSSTANIHRQALESYNIQRLMKEVMAFQKFPRSPYVVLYPDPVLPRTWGYKNVQTPVVNALKFSGHAVDYVTEKRLRDGRLDKYDYDFIVLPSANFIADDTFNRIGEYVKQGGRAIVVGELPDKDPMEHPRDLGWLETPDNADPLYEGATNGVSFACGDGRVWIMPTADEKTLQRDLEIISEGIIPVRPVVLHDIEYRTIPWKNKNGEDVYLTFAINEWMDEPLPLKPTVFNVEMESAVDLISNQKIDIDKPLVLPKAMVMLIEWKPKR